MKLMLEHTIDPLREHRAELARLRRCGHPELADVAERLYWRLRPSRLFSNVVDRLETMREDT